LKNKLYNIEFGSFTTQDNKILFSISKQLFFLDSEKSLNEMIAETEDKELFLPVEKAEEDKAHYLLTYQVDFATFKNLKSIKSESPAVRFAIAKTIMEQDILNHYNGSVSVYPANIWYHPMSTVKYAYRGDYVPSMEKEPKLVRYKALLLYILIGYPYGKALDKEYRIDRKKNPFAIQIANAESIEELRQLVADEANTLLYQDIKTHKNKNMMLKAILGLSIGLLLITNVITFMSTRNILKVSAEAEMESQLLKAENEIATLKLNEQIQEAVNADDFEKAGALMEEKETSRQEIADFMFENHKYNLALQYNPDLLETILQDLYTQEKTDTILKLKLSDEGNEELTKKLGLEQAIVTYDTEKMDAEWEATADGYTLLRAANAYFKNGNQQTAKDISSKLESLEYKEEASYINALITQAEAKGALQTAEKSLEEANALAEDDADRENRITEAQNSINTAKEKVTEAEAGVTDADQKLQEAWRNESQNN